MWCVPVSVFMSVYVCVCVSDHSDSPSQVYAKTQHHTHSPPYLHGSESIFTAKLCACIHTKYIHTYIHACTHTRVPYSRFPLCACIHTKYIHTYIHACTHACLPHSRFPLKSRFDASALKAQQDARALNTEMHIC